MGRVEIILAGLGGQGMITAGIILARAVAIHGKKNVAQVQSYGPEARGGSARSEVVISDQEIIYPHVTNPDILVVMSKQALENYISKLKPSGTLIYDSSLLEKPKKEGITIYGIPATRIASENLKIKGVANIVMLGVLIEITQIIDKKAIEKTIKEVFPEKFWEKDLKALKMGIEVAKKLIKFSQQASQQQK